jgi:hypothetical protein
MFSYETVQSWLLAVVKGLPKKVKTDISIRNNFIPYTNIRFETSEHLGEVTIRKDGKATVMLISLKEDKYIRDEHEIALKDNEPNEIISLFKFFENSEQMTLGYTFDQCQVYWSPQRAGSKWCWAAGVEMITSFAGRRVTQHDVVICVTRIGSKNVAPNFSVTIEQLIEGINRVCVTPNGDLVTEFRDNQSLNTDPNLFQFFATLQNHDQVTIQRNLGNRNLVLAQLATGNAIDHVVVLAGYNPGTQDYLVLDPDHRRGVITALLSALPIVKAALITIRPPCGG